MNSDWNLCQYNVQIAELVFAPTMRDVHAVTLQRQLLSAPGIFFPADPDNRISSCSGELDELSELENASMDKVVRRSIHESG